MTFAYADPPYVGQSRKYYGGVEVNHPLLIAHLCDDYPDGWILSCSTPSLKTLLPLCPDDVRIGAWVKPFVVAVPKIRPIYGWEPVIYRGGRRARSDDDFTRDWLAANIPTLATNATRSGVTGAKPDAFCYWVFALLNARPGDDLIDLFPGSGAVSIAWRRFQRQRSLFDAGDLEPATTAALFPDTECPHARATTE